MPFGKGLKIPGFGDKDSTDEEANCNSTEAQGPLDDSTSDPEDGRFPKVEEDTPKGKDDEEKLGTTPSPSDDIEQQQQPHHHHRHRHLHLHRHLKATSSDVGADLYAEKERIGEERLQQLERKVRWKLDLIIMPIVATTHALQFLNKSTPNFVAALGIKTALGLQHGRYAWFAAIFNFGFMAWAFPTNLIIQRVPIAKYTGSVILVWALLQMCSAAPYDYGGILAVRFVLGMAEAAIAPSAMNIVSLWYPRTEAPFRLCIVLGCNGGAFVVASLLSYGEGHATHIGIEPWQLYFLTTGCLNFCVGVIFLIFVPDTPHNAWWLSHEEKVCCVWRTSKNAVGLKNKTFRWYQVREALRDFKVWCTWIMAAAIGIIIGGVINFSTALVQGFGYSDIRSTILQLPLGAIAFVVVPIAGLIATIYPARCIMTICLCIPPLVGLIVIRTLPLQGHRYDLLGMAWLQLLVLGLICLNWIIMTGNIGGHTKRTFANGVWFVLFAAGNIGGTHIFLPSQAPRYITAITVLYICYAVIIVTVSALWAWLWVSNHRRDRKMKADGQSADEETREAILAGFRDETDMENRGFRYVY